MAAPPPQWGCPKGRREVVPSGTPIIGGGGGKTCRLDAFRPDAAFPARSFAPADKPRPSVRDAARHPRLALLRARLYTDADSGAGPKGAVFTGGGSGGGRDLGDGEGTAGIPGAGDGREPGLARVCDVLSQNFTAGFLGLCLPAVAALCLSARSRLGAFGLGVAAALMAGVLAATGSRAWASQRQVWECWQPLRWRSLGACVCRGRGSAA